MDISCLLPGDQAPSLKLSHAFDGSMQDASVVFDRFTVIILWNAGCAGCLPIVEQVSALPVLTDAACYAVAVMVRDVRATTDAAIASNSKAVLALEERPTVDGLFRGSVTRNWLEPSGQFGVPAGFAVDPAGHIIWMGDPERLPSILPDLRSSRWDVQAARREWLATYDELEISRNRINREITELLVAGMTPEAIRAMDDAERQMPSIAADKEYATLKLTVLAENPVSVPEAIAHYALAAKRFAGDPDVQTALAAVILSKFRAHNLALEIAVNQLSLVCLRQDENDGLAPATAWAFLQLAEIFNLSGRRAESVRSLDCLESLLTKSRLPRQIETWITAELARVRASTMS